MKENMGIEKFEMQHHHREGNGMEDSLQLETKTPKGTVLKTLQKVA